MDNNYSFDSHARAGTIGGFVFALLIQIRADDMVRTAVLAVIAAVVSFTVSLLLKMLMKWVKRKSS